MLRENFGGDYTFMFYPVLNGPILTQIMSVETCLESFSW